MTSSLVGSEMCIRDRNHLPFVIEIYKWQVSQGRKFLHKHPCSAWSWQVAVSYTHLTLPTICSV
eukprot:8695743-Prorocentrum_lima.AAC.1